MIAAIFVVISGITLALTSGDYKYKDYYFLHNFSSFVGFIAVEQIMTVNGSGDQEGLSMCVASACVFGYIYKESISILSGYMFYRV